MGWVKSSVVSGMAVAVLVLCGSSFAAGPAGQEIVAQSQDEVTFTVRLPHYRLDTLVYDGIEYTQPFAAGLVPFAEVGEPDLTLFSVLLALPEGAEARLVSSSFDGWTVLDGLRITPVPRIEATGDGPDALPDYVYEEDPDVFGSEADFPRDGVWLGDSGRLRHQNVVQVLISPFRYRPLESTLSVAREITVTVAFEGAALLRGPGPSEDAWEGVYREALVNYEQGRRWRAARPSLLGMPAVTNDRVRIMIDSTGIHRIGYATLAGIGFPPDVPVDEIFLYRDRFKDGAPDTVEIVESALEIGDNDEDGVFSEGDSISFFALDFYDQFGGRGGEDYFFDKNVYWLSWGEGEHKRIGPAAGWRDGPEPARPEHFTDFIHEERDSLFINYPPVGETDLYGWRRAQSSFTFTLPGIDNSFSSTLVAKFVNYVTHQRINTSIDFSLTGCGGVETPIGTYLVSVPSIQTHQFTVPAGFLCEEGGVFRFESDLDSYERPGNVLDWFEIFYERRYEAWEDVLTFTNGDITGEVEFDITGFSGTDIWLFDVTDTTNPVRIVLGSERIAPGDQGFDLTFRDSVSSAARYMALTRNRVREVLPDRLELVGPPRLRDISANYIAISHPDFVDALDPLVDLREEQGHTVEVATTQEVYDDFGGGIKSDTAIKRFIKNTYFNSNAQFVLLVGDANTDRRGVQLETPQPTMTDPAPPWPSDIDYLPSHNLYVDEIRTRPNREIKPSEIWFAQMDDDRFPDLYIGRLPVGSAAEAAGVVEKILTFESYEGSDPWKKRLLVYADDYYSGTSSGICYSGSDRAFQRACDSAAVIAKDFAVVAPETVKYYFRRCTKDDQPTLRTDQSGACTNAYLTGQFIRSNCTPELRSLLNDGAFLANFQGHSNRQQMTYEGLIRDFNTVSGTSYTDVQGLSNGDKPFVFLGFGCWISNFHDQGEGSFTMNDAIAEKFLLNPDGGACGTFASSCAELIRDNELYNPYVIRAFFTHLQGLDLEGNPQPARVLLGEGAITALLRFTVPSRGEFAEKHIVLGDPAMIMDMGPPLLEVTANGTPVGDSYIYTGSDTLTVVAGIKDEEAIMSIDLAVAENGTLTPVAPDAYTATALVDTDFTRSRAYEVVYDHVPLLGEYAIEIGGEDYSGKSSGLEIRVETGSAVFYKDGKQLEPGDPLVFGQTLRIEIARPAAVGETEIQAAVDSVPASGFEDYTLEMLDAEGKEWEISFIPSLEPGYHTVTVTVQGLAASRGFEYVPARVDVFADDKIVYDNDYVPALAEFEIVVEAGAGIGTDDLGVDLDGEEVPVTFVADSTGVVFKASFGVDLDPGEHQITVTVFGVSVDWAFRVADDLLLSDVSVFPNPFSGETHFFYTLSRSAREVGLSIYTVSGRLVFEGDMPVATGYNQYLWDGRDMAMDRVANGTYLYRIVARAGSRERESTGWVVKIE